RVRQPADGAHKVGATVDGEDRFDICLEPLDAQVLKIPRVRTRKGRELEVAIHAGGELRVEPRLHAFPCVQVGTGFFIRKSADPQGVAEYGFKRTPPGRVYRLGHRIIGRLADSFTMSEQRLQESPASGQKRW